MAAAAPVVIVGASLAGHRAAQAIRGTGHDGELVVLGQEAHAPYTRPPLSKELLAGAQEADACALRPADLDVTWRLGERAVGLDLEARRVMLDDGEPLAFAKLLVATGCRPRPWPSGPIDLEGVFLLREIDDALRLRAALGRADAGGHRRRRLHRLRGGRHRPRGSGSRSPSSTSRPSPCRRSAPRWAPAARGSTPPTGWTCGWARGWRASRERAAG